VVEACEAGTDVAAVDVIGRYTDAAGEVTRVSSCDVYEFRNGLVSSITSYAVELL
jgi:ketosteroid isomerase-like protein